jgi:hypothetical protein
MDNAELEIDFGDFRASGGVSVRLLGKVRDLSGGSDCRQDQIVFVELWAVGFSAAGIGRVQCQVGQKRSRVEQPAAICSNWSMSPARAAAESETPKLRLIPLARQPNLASTCGDRIAQALDHAANPGRHECAGGVNGARAVAA